MKAPKLTALCLASLVVLPALAVDDVIKSKGPVRERPPVFRAPGADPQTTTNPPATTGVLGSQVGANYSQGSVAGRSPLVTREQAQAVMARFKRGYAKLGAPRIVLSVNRELVDEGSGLSVTERREKRESYKADLTADPNAKPGAGQLGSNVTIVGNVAGESAAVPAKGSTERVTAENTYRREQPKPLALADKTGRR